ncbi:redoxin domain-containing protein [Nocardia macrotermitis]|uniref:Thioredoxin domain-containing protein n=1 Tax=Nocardia macrotermitis TaxID=2585198 RepID=A0A7K0D975_9NOCA|nr:redoxin domain-containing protein [Nocardia macrotermitis]MQY22258.1 hypothetical protein [Nocardia macrotermitis]
MIHLESAPGGVRRWFDVLLSPAALLDDLRPILAPSVVFTFAGRRIEGVDAVLAHARTMPVRRLGDGEWSVLPVRDDHRVTVRITGPDGASLPGPGGPMVAMDFEFTLDDQGRITGLSPHPHHLEPADLAAALSAGMRAPDFTLPDTSGTPVSLHADHDGVTVVVFTCNACPWALGWHDRLQQVARDYAGAGVRMLQINGNDPQISPRDTTEESRRRVTEGDFASPYLLDAGQRIARQWGARHTPDVFVLNPDGVIAYHGAPDADAYDDSLHAQWLRTALDHILTGGPTIADTEPIGCTIKWTL